MITEKNERTITEVVEPECERRLVKVPDAFIEAGGNPGAASPIEAASLALQSKSTSTSAVGRGRVVPNPARSPTW